MEVLLLPQEGRGWRHCGGGGRGWRNWPGFLSCPEEKAQKLEAWQLWWRCPRGEFSTSEAAQLEAVALSLEPREGRGKKPSCILLRNSINSFSSWGTSGLTQCQM